MKRSFIISAVLLALASIGSLMVRSETSITGTSAGGGGTHAANHAENGSDELLVENLGTACPGGETGVSDGSGGLDCTAVSSGGTTWATPAAFGSLSTCDGGADGTYTALTDGGFDFVRCNGASWVPFWQGYQMSPPQSSEIGTTWTWVNQGTSTAANTLGPLLLSAPANGSINIRALVTTAPATPWTKTVHMRSNIFDTNYHKAGMVIRNSGTGSIFACYIGWDAIIKVNASTYTNATTFGSHQINAGWENLDANGDGVWIRVGDNGTNATCEIGPRLDMMRTVYATWTTGYQEYGIFAGTESATHAVRASFQDLR